MNFLAHIYLSGENEELMIGNFIADFIKGNQFHHLPDGIKQGILLHRKIDTYTDQHHVVRQSTQKLHADYHKYAGVIVDIYYDHFLASNWERYSATKLVDFAENTYQTLLKNQDILPEKVQEILPYMLTHNWLVNYAKIEMMENTFQRLSQRISNRNNQKENNLHLATANLQKDYILFEEEFHLFFDDLRLFVKKEMDETKLF